MSIQIPSTTPGAAAQRCQNPKCTNLNSVTKRCSQCRQAMYCGQTCQQADWRQHKIVCTSRPVEVSPSSMNLNSLFKPELIPIISQHKTTIERLFSPLDLDRTLNIALAAHINKFSVDTLCLLIQYPDAALSLFSDPWGIHTDANKLPPENLELVLQFPKEAKKLSSKIDFMVEPLIDLHPKKLEFLLRSKASSTSTEELLTQPEDPTINQLSIEKLTSLLNHRDNLEPLTTQTRNLTLDEHPLFPA